MWVYYDRCRRSNIAVEVSKEMWSNFTLEAMGGEEEI